MALKRVPPNEERTKATFSRPTLSDQDLRDIYAALDELTDSEPSGDGKVEINVNDYRADSVDDVLGIEDPVKSLTLVAVGVQVFVHVAPEGAVLRWSTNGNHADRTRKVAAKVEYILRQREVIAKGGFRDYLKLWLLMLGLTNVLGVGTALTARELFSDVLAGGLGIAVSLATVIVLSVASIKRRTSKPISVLRRQVERPEPWHRRYNVELMLILTFLAIVVPSLIAVAVAP